MKNIDFHSIYPYVRKSKTRFQRTLIGRYPINKMISSTVCTNDLSGTLISIKTDVLYMLTKLASVAARDTKNEQHIFLIFIIHKTTVKQITK
jgi:hypothetical protein